MQPLQKKKWMLRTQNAPVNHSETVQELSQKNGIPPLVAKLLLLRGVDSFSTFLKPNLDKLCDPFLMKGMHNAVSRIIKALECNEKILIYGDYDVDGITSTTILTHFLRSLGAENVAYRIPDRFRDGYGLKSTAIDDCRRGNITLLITVDCGITSVEEVQYGKECGVDIIVTDHHECQEKVPDAVAVLNPKQPDCQYPFQNLAGVGVAFKLMEALAKSRDLDMQQFYETYIAIVSIGTVADVMPLVGENRILVKNGLETLGRTNHFGLCALMKQASVDPLHVTTGTIGFALSPRINAAGRMDDAALGVELLLSETAEEAEEKARYLDEINRKRQTVEQQILEEALALYETEKDQYERESVLILAKEGWHSGIIGIVASRLTERFNKPCILISINGNESKGSGRSMKGFSLFEALSACNECLVKFGGHELAAGLTVAADQIMNLRNKINQYAQSILTPEDFIPTILIDTKLPVSYANLNTVNKLSVLEPFGMHNPNPVFYCDALTVLGVYTMSDGKHLRLSLSDGASVVQAIGFSMGNMAEKLSVGAHVDIVFTLEANVYRGERKAQLLLKDLRLSS